MLYFVTTISYQAKFIKSGVHSRAGYASDVHDPKVVGSILTTPIDRLSGRALSVKTKADLSIDCSFQEK